MLFSAIPSFQGQFEPIDSINRFAFLIV